MFFIPFIPLLCCCSSSSLSLLLFRDRIPSLENYLPIIFGSFGSCICISTIICIMITIGIFYSFTTIGKTLVE